MSPRGRKLALFALPVLVFAAILLVWLAGDLLTLGELKRRQLELQALIRAKPVAFTAAFLLMFGIVAAVMPGAAILKVAAGALFGLWGGMAVALGGTLLGAVIGFLGSRYLMRHWVEQRFARQAAVINRGLERDGIVYLLALRFNPLIPFFLINFALGLTRMRATTFTVVSLFGLLPASFVYANAGTELARIEQPSDILSTRLILSLILLSVMPVAGRWLSKRLGGQRAIAEPLERA
ncbi:MAG: TVP38/TMEM64 family protein [Allosphingosinicella sp.]|uniref:TVP38/TMEM64 family protein n=1 Tax=Allosphingosinicella sp. TaxID=2823234 RepID=UPI00395AE120